MTSGPGTGPAGRRSARAGRFPALPIDLGFRALVIGERTIQPHALGTTRLVDLSAHDVPTLAQVHDAAVQLSCPALRRYPDPIRLSHFWLSLNQPRSREKRAATAGWRVGDGASRFIRTSSRRDASLRLNLPESR